MSSISSAPFKPPLGKVTQLPSLRSLRLLLPWIGRASLHKKEAWRMPMSKRCIPYTPRSRELADSVIALVSTAGVHLREQEPYNVDGDNTWRLLPGDVSANRLMVTHSHYNHQDANQDINCVFPIDRLRELAAEG